MTHRGPFQPLLFCDSVISGKADLNLRLVKDIALHSQNGKAAEPKAKL